MRKILALLFALLPSFALGQSIGLTNLNTVSPITGKKGFNQDKLCINGGTSGEICFRTSAVAGTTPLDIGIGGTLGSAAFTASSAYEVPLTFSTGLTRTTNTVTVNTSQNIATLSNLTTNGLVKTTGGTGALSVDTTAYGTGSVTSVSVTTANGVSGTVATATTTPAISLTLGAITPTSVAASGTLTGSNLSGTNTGDQTITLTGNVTGSGTGSFATTLAAIPSAVPASGSILFTNTAAPSTPASGKTSTWTDSTTKTLKALNDAGTLSTTVIADTGASNNFLTAISAGGVVSKAQPAFSNLSGSVAAAQMPALTGDVTTSAGAVATTLATVNSNVGTFGSATKASVVTFNGKGLATAASESTVTPAVGSITGLGTGVATLLGGTSSGTGGPVGSTAPTISAPVLTGNIVGATSSRLVVGAASFVSVGSIFETKVTTNEHFVVSGHSSFSGGVTLNSLTDAPAYAPMDLAATQVVFSNLSGPVHLGGTATRGTTNPTNALNLFDGTAPAGTLTNGGTVYSSSGQLWVMDSAGVSTLLTQGAWTSFTPTITALSGTFTTVSGAGFYKMIGKSVLFRMTVTCTTVGSAAGAVLATLPVTAAAANGAGAGRSSAGNMQSWVLFSTTQAIIVRYDNTFDCGSGVTLTLSGIYEAA